MCADKTAKDQKSKAIESTVGEQAEIMRPGDTTDPTATTADNRLERIGDHLRSSLNKPDALQATIGAANSDVMQIGYRVNQAIQAAMESTPTTFDEYGKLMPAVDALLRINKQITQFTQLELRLAKAGQAAANVVGQAAASAAASEETAI